MVKEVELPDGTIAEFPDGMADDAIEAVLRRELPRLTERDAPREKTLREAIADPETRDAALKQLKRRVDRRLPGEFLRQGRGAIGGALRPPVALAEIARRAATGAPRGDETAFDKAGGIVKRIGLAPEGTGASAAVGEIASFVVPSAAIGRAAGAIPRLGQALQFQSAQPILNTARAAGIGAAEGAAVESVTGGDPAQGAAQGAALGPIGGAVVRTGGEAVNLIRRFTNNKSDAALRQLADSVDADELNRRVQKFRQDTGEDPTLVEILRENAQEIVSATGNPDRNVAAKLALAEGVDRIRAGSQERLARTIKNDRLTLDERAAKAKGNAIFKRFMERNQTRDVTLTPAEADYLLREGGSVIPRRAREVLSQSTANGAPSISLLDADNIRKAFNKAGDAGGEAHRFKDLGSNVREIAARSVKGYDSTIARTARFESFARGVKEGRKVSSAKATTFSQSLAQADRPTLRGLKVGARTGPADEARTSPQSAERTARALSESEALKVKLTKALGPEEATRIATSAKAQVEALQSAGDAIRGTKFEAALQREIKNAQSSAEMLSLLSAGTGAGFKFAVIRRAIERYVSQFGVPPAAAKRLADAAVDPKQTNELVSLLRRFGIEPTAAQEFARSASVVATPAALTVDEASR